MNTPYTPIGHVYVLQAEGGPVKIGISIRPAQRVSQISAASGRSFSRIFVSHKITEPRLVEQKVHKIFQAHRLPGEWFSISFDDAVREVHLLTSQITGPNGEECSDVIRSKELGERYKAMLDAGASSDHLQGFAMALGDDDVESLAIGLRSSLIGTMAQIMEVYDILNSEGLPNAEAVIDAACDKSGITEMLKKASLILESGRGGIECHKSQNKDGLLDKS